MNSQRILTSSSKLLKASGRDLSANDLQRVASNPGLKRCSTTSTSNLMGARKASNASWDLKTPRSAVSAKFSSSSSFKQKRNFSSLLGLASSQTGSAAMENATWAEVATAPNVSYNPFSLEMNCNGVSANQPAGSANPFLSMMGMLQPITAEEAKEDIIDNSDDKDRDGEIQEEDTDDGSYTFTIPTFQERPSKRLNTRNLTNEDLETLKEEDPFMYYSIPEVRRAVFSGQDVDLTTVAPIVKRRRVISYESADLPSFEHLQEAYDEMGDGSSSDSFMVTILSSMQGRQ